MAWAQGVEWQGGRTCQRGLIVSQAGSRKGVAVLAQGSPGLDEEVTGEQDADALQVVAEASWRMPRRVYYLETAKQGQQVIITQHAVGRDTPKEGQRQRQGTEHPHVGDGLPASIGAYVTRMGKDRGSGPLPKDRCTTGAVRMRVGEQNVPELLKLLSDALHVPFDGVEAPRKARVDQRQRISVYQKVRVGPVLP